MIDFEKEIYKPNIKLIRLRIFETLKEMFSEPRIIGIFFYWVLPTLACFTNEHWTWNFVYIVSGSLFIFCFLLVRFSL